jgi:dTDP-4-amino-4,6-dideoxygalactose transaminase
VKLPYLKEWNNSRRDLAATYNEQLCGINGIEVPQEPSWSRSIFHLYVITCGGYRDELQKYLTENGIGTGLHYPIPCHLQTAYRHLGCGKGDLPLTESLAHRILSLPMFPQIRKDQQERVAEAIRRFCGNNGSAAGSALDSLTGVQVP